MTQDHSQSTGPTSGLTHRQYRAIECLASSPTVADAAKRTGVGRASLYRWLKDPLFKAACEQRREETLSFTKQRTKELLAKTFDNLEDMLRSPDPNTRIQVGKIVMEYQARLMSTRTLEAAPKPYMIESAISPPWSNDP